MRLRTAIRAAFTLVEMLVVIIIITAILLIAVPSFQAMLNSTESAMAESMLKAGLRAGKDAALRSTGDQDSAVVFFYPPGGRLTMGVYVKVGTLNDSDGVNNVVQRDIFVPTGLNEPVQLPKGWMVRGFAPPNGTSSGSDDSLLDPCTQWYESYSNRPMNSTQANWVFPETHFYDTGDSDSGEHRQTFMVRFEAGTGIMRIGAANTALIFDPGPNAAWRGNGEFNTYRADQTDDPIRFITRILNAPAVGTGALDEQERRSLIGWESSDMVLAKPVSQLALYEEVKLASGIGVRPDRTTGCLYLPFQAGSDPSLVARADAGNMTRDINRWITGDTSLNGQYRPVDGAGVTEDAPEARIFTIDRYTGGLQTVEVQ